MSRPRPVEPMTVGHRKFLQSFMSRCVLNSNETLTLLKTCCEDYDETRRKQHLMDYCQVINDNIQAFGMELKQDVDQHDGLSYYGLVNTTESSITLFASLYSQIELDFFKNLLDAIVKSDTGSIGSIAAMNISNTLSSKKISKAAAQSMLDRYEQDHWIGKTKGGQVYLGSRGNMELDQYIFEMFSEYAVRCNLCTKLCLQGQICRHCSTRLHTQCARKFFKGHTTKECPRCKEPWPVTSNKQNTNGQTKSQPSTSTDCH